MTPDALAVLHAACFQWPRPWRAAEFAALLASRGIFLLTEDGAFLLGRVALDEAELLTLAVSPERRRLGLGRRLVDAFRQAARDAGAHSAFLEVAADNTAALALYAATGWTAAGRRRNYYAPGLDALVLKAALPGA